MKSLDSYIIPQSGLDWPDLLASWAWLLPPEVTVWIVNRFGDLFLVLDDGAVHMLDVGAGSLSKVASSREDFSCHIDEGGNANKWLLIPLVDELEATGITLGKGQCYSYWRLPALGGAYSMENVKVVSLEHQFKAFGPIHEKIKDLPDGTRIKFEIAG
jgi:hypothetical protein